MTPGASPQPVRRRGRLAAIAIAAMLGLAAGGYALWSTLLRPTPTEQQLLAPEEIPARSSGGGGGPSGGAPSDAQVRRELARLQGMSRRYHFDQFDFSGRLIPFDALPSDGWRQSIASVYYLYGQGLACGGVLRPDQLGVAHKTAPCGTLITFRYGGRAIRVPVIDRGPYIAGREWDFTGATAAALGFPGLGVVDWHV
jgi:rare lipoprotein A (RlpA)-like double-psi beta-barrel protein